MTATSRSPSESTPARTITRGLVGTVVPVLLLAIFVDLTALASPGGAVALTIFLLVCVAAYRLRRETRSRTAVIVAGHAATVVVLAAFAPDPPWSRTRRRRRTARLAAGTR